MWGNLNIFQKLLCTAHTTISWYFMDHKTINGDKRQHRICMLNSLIERKRDANNPKNSTRKANKNCGKFSHITKKSHTKYSTDSHRWARHEAVEISIRKYAKFSRCPPRRLLDNDVYLTSYVVRSEAEIRAHIPWMLLKQVNIILKAIEQGSWEFSHRGNCRAKTFIKILHSALLCVWHVDEFLSFHAALDNRNSSWFIFSEFVAVDSTPPRQNRRESIKTQQKCQTHWMKFDIKLDLERKKCVLNLLAKRDKIMRVRGRAECSHDERASSKKIKNSHSMSCCLFNWKIFRGGTIWGGMC